MPARAMNEYTTDKAGYFVEMDLHDSWGATEDLVEQNDSWGVTQEGTIHKHMKKNYKKNTSLCATWTWAKQVYM